MNEKSLKKIHSVLSIGIAFVMLLTCFGCNRKDDKNPKPEKIADNLYEITFTDYFNWDVITAPEVSDFACSAVQNGKYRGRNYDWTYADTDLCIVHTASLGKRHASVGVADLSFIANKDRSVDPEKIPFVTVDGINDAGVCIQVNVMPYGENGPLNHTETKNDDLEGGRVVRYILDYAESVTNAIELLTGKDISSEMEKAEELHWMISGPTSKEDRTIKTVVIEVFPDGIHVTDNFVDNKPIMTNFNIYNFNGTPESVGVGLGYERWQILNENFDQADSVIGTFDLMEKVYFTKLYDLFGERFWYSEYNGVNLLNYYDEATLKNLLGEEKYNSCLSDDGGLYYTSALWDGKAVIKGDISKTGCISPVVEVASNAYMAQNNTDGSLWITVHTSVYDLENLTLDIQLRESQDHLHFSVK